MKRSLTLIESYKKRVPLLTTSMSHGVIKIILFHKHGNEYTICLFDLKTLNTCLLICHLVCLSLYEHQWLFNWTSILTM